MFIAKIKNNTRGDTIIEVLIAMAILALILTGGYVTTNKSLQQIQGAQEKNQALGIAQYQLETLRALASNNTSGLNAPGNSGYLPGTSGPPSTNNPFCFSTGASLLAYTNANCGNFASGASAIRYNVKITGIGTGVTQPGGQYPISTYTFQIQVTWNGHNQDITTDQIDLYYRVAT